MQEFFQLPSESKLQTTDNENNSGYSVNVASNKQQFQYRSKRTKCDTFFNESIAENAMQDCVTLCKQFIFQWIKGNTNILEKTVVDDLELALNRDYSYWSQFSVLLATEYMNTIAFGESVIDNCPSHTDAGLVTMCIGPQEGLQLLDNSTKSWISVSGADNIVLFFGDTICALSNNVIKSVEHKVVSTEEKRFPVVFKFRAGADVVGPRESDRQTNDLDQYILQNIFLYLPHNHLCKVELVCKHWRIIASSNFIWRAQCMLSFGAIAVNVVSWKNLYKQKFKTQPTSKCLVNVPKTLKSNDDRHCVKLTVVGDGAVGKTCLLITYDRNYFPEDALPTVFDAYSTTVDIDDNIVSLSVWDTAGQDEYNRLRPFSYPGTDVFLIVFDVSSRTSFNHVETKWIPELKQYVPNVPIILVGAKIDRRECPMDCVTYDEGVNLANRIQAVAYYEVSSMKHSTNIRHLLHFAAKIGLQHSLKIPFDRMIIEITDKSQTKKKKCMVQ
jgi:Ras-related C3 botulinum toxin substrate 1